MTAVQGADRSPHGFSKSLLLHGGLVAILAGYEYWIHRERDRFGDPNSLGASAGVTAVSQIPMFRKQGRTQRVANDSQSQLPTPVKPEPKAAAKPDDPKAIALKKREKTAKKEIAASNPRYKSDPVLPNQLTSSTAPALVSPMIGVTGSGGVGTSAASPFGNRFAWYEKLIRERIAQKWHTEDIDQRMKTAPPSVVTFTIGRDGQVSAVKVIQSSGNYALDQAAQRAVYDANPLPPLPPGFERNSANTEFWFELKR